MTSTSTIAQVKKPVTKASTVSTKFGALAIDRSNGFYYGYSSDASTKAEAESRAIAECNKRGGNCSIVLTFSGTGCAAYRTINGNVGTAFGWGIGKTKEEADAIAIKECLKRSNGISPPNFVWSCNSSGTGILKEIYNASSEIVGIKVVKIGNQNWSDRNLDVSTFQNGDPIFEAKTIVEWQKAADEQKPAYVYLNYDKANGKKFGKIYNIYAVMDTRGLAPKGYRIATRNDWVELGSTIGDLSTAAGKLKSKTGWTNNNGTDDYGFNALPAGNCCFNGIGGAASYWSSTSANDKNQYGVTLYSGGHYYEVSTFYKSAGRYVRYLKD